VDVPESARIVAVVDVFDALTHDRVHRPALPENEALAVMGQGIGTHFDPHLMASFFSQVPEIRRIAEQNPDQPASLDLPVSVRY
jgi:putative two-component system response regulator